MRQTRRLHDHSQIAGLAPVGQGAAKGFADTHAQRAAHTADFQGVGQPRVNVVIAGDRVHLGLTPEAAEGARENDPVVVLVERAAPQFLRAVQGFAKALAGEQGLPIQGRYSIG